MYSRMMAEHFGISILESDARLLHERITMLISEAYTRGARTEREACAKVADEWVHAYPHPSEVIAQSIRARGQE
jgi:hypothetical protein